MPTTEAIQHINRARQILVGVVPNPTSQIDQITNALIYKFMDDMDQSAIKAGGNPSFFIGDLEKYAWSRLMDPRLGNQERMNLYAEALTKFSEAKQLPELFRNIFRSAFLPYRTPETLGLFLKEINYFDYSHPEELGNAYEYLLSIMSSQGDAGQFRTPRHIIDFIVKVVDPSKDDKILDPACGTGGFLVSSYKHILEQHDGVDENGKPNNEKPLTPDDKKKIMKNFEGYDIDPGMVRIAQVNMYLHQFKNPKIFQYDSLSSEERWADKFDVVLANPPFMSPQGGIRPHNKFSVQSTRSEVLFVDYIMHHLRPKGRAGIIVPEGVIFQSGNVYKELRKNLVEDGLYAVVSLPSGVFQPYSGVKTSILFFDNEIAKNTKQILFIKVENDGFTLGAQRRPNGNSDLNNILIELNHYRSDILGNYKQKSSQVIDFFNRELKVGDKNFLSAFYEKYTLVSKDFIAENGDYNLSGDGYRVATNDASTKWPLMVFEDIVFTKTPPAKIPKEHYKPVGSFPIIDQSQDEIAGWTNDTTTLVKIEKPLVIFGDHTCAVKYTERAFAQGADGIKILTTNDQLIPKYLYYLLKTKPVESEGYQRHFAKLKRYKIPLPPLEIQEQIVTELDGYQKIIDGAKQIVANWKPKIDIDPEWEKVKLREITDRVTKGTTPTTNGFQFQESGINFVKIETIDEGGYFIKKKFAYINQECNNSLKRSQLKENDILFSIAGALGRVALVDSSILPANTNQALAIISPKKELDSKYLEQILRSDLIQSQIFGLKVGVAQSNLSLAQVSDFEIPLPPLAIQKQIVVKIEAERALVESAKKLIGIYEGRVKGVVGKLWEG